jgi:heavy metal translocating P-type ATPase
MEAIAPHSPDELSLGHRPPHSLPRIKQGIVADLRQFIRPFIAALPAAGLMLGFAAQMLGAGFWSSWIWAVGTVPVLLVLLAEIVMSLRGGDVGLDIIAAVSMAAALGTGQFLAAAIVALMYSGGKYIEGFAEGHARREMTMLLERVPRTAIRHRNDDLEEITLELIAPGDRLLIRQGDVVPVDGTVFDGLAVLDQSALTGESIPVQHRQGDTVMSGSTNVGPPFDLFALRPAAESTYAGIVRLVETAQRSKAPMSRLADRYAMGFLAVTLMLAAGAWYWSGSTLRAVAVLVVATPCPLILAVPIAIVSGLSRAAKRGILVKSGKALETLARVRALVIDKTGTLTQGEARLVTTKLTGTLSSDEVLAVAASLDYASKHVIARTLVSEAQIRELKLATPADVVETPGEGIEGRVGGRRVVVGGLRFVAEKLGVSRGSLPYNLQPGEVAVAVAVDRELVGVLSLADRLRSGIAGALREVRSLGIERIVLATGDRREVADAIAESLPIDLIRTNLTPDQKTLVVLSERKNGPVMMIGDGINDAPALAAADLGLAMGAKGGAASAEAADAVLVVDEFDRIPTAIRIARRARFIAIESVYAGIGLSGAAMIAAAFGLINPVEGALLQEVIDVAVILNALRVLRDPSANESQADLEEAEGADSALITVPVVK